MAEGSNFYGEQNGTQPRQNRRADSIYIPLRCLPPDRWQIASGDLIRIDAMEAQHISRVLALLHRWAIGAKLQEALSNIRQFNYFSHGYGATMAFEQELEDLASMPPEAYARANVPPYAAMERRLRELGAPRRAKPAREGTPTMDPTKPTALLVGTHFRGEFVKAIANRLPVGTALLLWPDPENQYSTSGKAVKVLIEKAVLRATLTKPDLDTLGTMAEGSGLDLVEFLSDAGGPCWLGFLADSAKTRGEYADASAVTDVVRNARLAEGGPDFSPDDPATATLSTTADGKLLVTLS